MSVIFTVPFLSVPHMYWYLGGRTKTWTSMGMIIDMDSLSCRSTKPGSHVIVHQDNNSHVKQREG